MYVKCLEYYEWLMNCFLSSGNVSFHGKFSKGSLEGILIQTILKILPTAYLNFFKVFFPFFTYMNFTVIFWSFRQSLLINEYKTHSIKTPPPPENPIYWSYLCKVHFWNPTMFKAPCLFTSRDIDIIYLSWSLLDLTLGSRSKVISTLL